MRTSKTFCLMLLAQFALVGCQSGEAQESQPETAPAVEEAAPAPEAPQADESQESLYYAIDTLVGRMVIKLHNDTPQHRDNFKKLADEGFYDGTTFHRVMNTFMIQGGDPNSKEEPLEDDGRGGPGYTVPGEFVSKYFHRRGAVAAARMPDGANPQRASSGSQFYIVHGGMPITNIMLENQQTGLRRQIPDPQFTYSNEAIAAYTTEGGAPQLDRMYSIFGELVEGFEVLDMIATSSTPRARGERVSPGLMDQPANSIPMTVTALPDYTEAVSNP